MVKKYLLIVLAGLTLAGCASTPEDEWADPRDPFEDFNRDMWDFNEQLDEAILWPAAKAYGEIPQPVRTGLRNVADNLGEVSWFVNNLLQGKVMDAGSTFWRFSINSTVGVLGIFDVATPLGIEAKEESFGETLASWGVTEGPYVMLPGLGPTVPIDRGGDVVDGMYFPIDNLNGPTSVARLLVKALDTRLRLQEQQALMENSLDPYGFVKEAYFQNWQHKVYDGNPPQTETDELDDDFYDQF
ncbi:VacJ family lipoprotein [Pseudidiomarina sp. PP-1MA]|uniref:VacJ family lipoprotein n=1 Tax=Pseudidiomarina sp. PP-1MA TaxID=3237706 RepID=A0AB39XBG3_9GAMM